jgi:hypothetical protein
MVFSDVGLKAMPVVPLVLPLDDTRAQVRCIRRVKSLVSVRDILRLCDVRAFVMTCAHVALGTQILLLLRWLEFRGRPEHDRLAVGGCQPRGLR